MSKTNPLPSSPLPDEHALEIVDATTRLYAMALNGGLGVLQQDDDEVERHPNQFWIKQDGGWLRVSVEWRDRRKTDWKRPVDG